MNQLQKLKVLLGGESHLTNDVILEYVLDNAGEIICDIRNTDYVEPKYYNAQLAIAIEIYNKRGAEGQSGHSENGVSRTYETGDISNSVLSKITPVVKTPFSKVRLIDVPETPPEDDGGGIVGPR